MTDSRHEKKKSRELITFTTSETCKLDISDFKRYNRGGVIQWESGHMVYIEPLQGRAYIQNLKTGVKQYLTIDCVPSNLGTGEIPYFICPMTGTRCKKLYRDIRTGLFVGREALKGVMFYPLQSCPKRYRAATRYFAIKRKVDRLESKRDAHTYAGKVTKRWLYTLKKKIELTKANESRAIALGNNLYSLTGGKAGFAS